MQDQRRLRRSCAGSLESSLIINTPSRRQSRTLILSTNINKNARNIVFDCHLSPDRRQKAIDNTVSSYFDPRSSIVKSVFDCHLPCVVMISTFLHSGFELHRINRAKTVWIIALGSFATVVVCVYTDQK